jgi:hypothetical protein
VAGDEEQLRYLSEHDLVSVWVPEILSGFSGNSDQIRFLI